MGAEIFEFTFDNLCKFSGTALDGIKGLLYKNMLLAVIIASTSEWIIMGLLVRHAKDILSSSFLLVCV